MDARIAAEMILLFVADLEKEGVAEPIVEPSSRLWHPLMARLHPDPGNLDRVLTDYGLSPHPGVVLVVEGETEEYIVPQLMRKLGFPRGRTFVDVLNGRSVDADFGLVAELLVTPTWEGDENANAVALTRPVTRLLVVTDPEGRHATLQDREDRRRAWVERVLKALPPAMRTQPVKDYVERLIEIEVWPSVFEFAHFGDGEIARAVVRAWRKAGGTPWNIRAADIRRLRRTSQNIEHLWINKRGKRPSKPGVARELWPLLERKVDAALADETFDAVPILQALRRAFTLATEFGRSRWWLHL